MLRAESPDPTTQPEAEPQHQLQRFRRRSKSTVVVPQRCHYPLAISVEALDLSTLSPAQAVASIRFLVLSHLAELETRLAQYASDSVDFGLQEKLKTGGELTKDEMKQWAQAAFNMLESIRAGVHSHLPETCLPAISVETFKSHLPDVPALTIITHLLDIHLPSLRNLPSIAQHAKSTAIRDVRSHLPDFNFVDFRSKLEDVRSRIHDLEFDKPLNYIPVLWERLETLHAHLLAMDMPHALELAMSGSDIKHSGDCDAQSNPGLLLSEAVKVGEKVISNAAIQLAEALKHSLHGTRLIQFVELPDEWKDNPFVHHGYRFIPIKRWSLILKSVFAFHNETLNIHTHLAPLMLWALDAVLFMRVWQVSDHAERLYTVFALLCLFSSAVWHTMSGCADRPWVEVCARLDYVGIIWLISASIATFVHYGFQCHEEIGWFFITSCFLIAVAGTVFPFMSWFNSPRYRTWRILFFLGFTSSACAPLAYMSTLYGFSNVLTFTQPLLASLLSYVVGLVIYATHLPERFVPPRYARVLNTIGAGSHALWHLCIIQAIYQHKTAIQVLKRGMIGGCNGP